MGNDVAIPDDENYTGLEDFDQSDAVIPRLKILHKEGLFEDNLSKQKFSETKLIILAMNKQRILWHPNVSEGGTDVPMCRSANFDLGFPVSKEEASKGKEFPWDRSGFDPSDFPPDDEGVVTLPCNGCKLKEWGSHPLGDKPYCAEQWTLSVLYDGKDAETGEYSEMWSVALLTLQKSGLKAIRAYLTSFMRAQQPAFTAVCKASLSLTSRGDVEYSKPSFSKLGPTDATEWAGYRAQARQMKEYLSKTPDRIEAENDEQTTNNNVYQPDAPPASPPSTPVQDAPAPAGDAQVNNSNNAAQVAEPAVPSAPVQATPPDDDDDLPF